MIYWLFSQGRAVLSALALPLLCIGITAPLLFAVVLGIGIQRRAEGKPLQTTGLMSIGRALCFLLPNLAVVALYVSLLGGTAVTKATTRQTPASSIVAFLIGGTSTINQARLAIFGYGLFSNQWGKLK